MHDSATNRRRDLGVSLAIRLVEGSLRFAGAIPLVPGGIISRGRGVILRESGEGESR